MKQTIACKRILSLDNREQFQKAYKHDGKLYVGCPYMVCVFNHDVADIPIHDDNYPFINFDSIIERVKSYDNEVILPSANDIQQYIKEQKLKHNKYERSRVFYDINDMCKVDAQYLFYMLSAMPNAKVYVCGSLTDNKKHKYYSIVYFEGIDCYGILCAIHRVD